MRANFSGVTIKTIKTRLKTLMAIVATTQNQRQPTGRERGKGQTFPKTSELLDLLVLKS